MSKILVTGATGTVGGQVVRQLAATGRQVRALVRDPGSATLPGGVEIVKGDLSTPDTLRDAVRGIDAVFLVWPLMSTEHAPRVLELIAAHARRIVYLSSHGIREDRAEQDDPITGTHAEMERLIARTGLEWTFLRPTGFAANTLAWAPGIRTDGVVREVHGELSRPLIHEHDMAAVGVHALTTGDLVGSKPVITGPEAVTTIEQIDAIGRALGRELRFEPVSPEVVRERMITGGWPAELVDAVLGAQDGMNETQPEPITSTVRDITGTPPRDFRRWAHDHVADFR